MDFGAGDPVEVLHEAAQVGVDLIDAHAQVDPAVGDGLGESVDTVFASRSNRSIPPWRGHWVRNAPPPSAVIAVASSRTCPITIRRHSGLEASLHSATVSEASWSTMHTSTGPVEVDTWGAAVPRFPASGTSAPN